MRIDAEFEDFDVTAETAELLADPELVLAIAEAEAERDAGLSLTLEEVKIVLISSGKLK